MSNPLENLYAYVRKSTAKREIMDEETARAVGLYVTRFFEVHQDAHLNNSLMLRNQITAWLIAKRHEETGEELATSTKQLIARHVGSYCVYSGWLNDKDYGILRRQFVPALTPWSDQALNEQQVHSLISYLHNRVHNSVNKNTVRGSARDLLAVMIMLSAGLRIGQITMLKQEDVIYKDGKLILYPILQKRKGTGKSVKTIPVDITIGGLKFSAALKLYEDVRFKTTEYYFHNQFSEKISNNYHRWLFQNIEKQLGFDFSSRTFRHTAGTRTARNVGIVAAADLLDHQSIQTTQRYVTLEKDTSNIISKSFQ